MARQTGDKELREVFGVAVEPLIVPLRIRAKLAEQSGSARNMQHKCMTVFKRD